MIANWYLLDCGYADQWCSLLPGPYCTGQHNTDTETSAVDWWGCHQCLHHPSDRPCWPTTPWYTTHHTTQSNHVPNSKWSSVISSGHPPSGCKYQVSIAEEKWRLSVILFQQRTQQIRDNLFNASCWTIPFFSHWCCHWLLGIVHFQKRELQYLDSIPLLKRHDMSKHGAQWVFEVRHPSVCVMLCLEQSIPSFLSRMWMLFGRSHTLRAGMDLTGVLGRKWLLR